MPPPELAEVTATYVRSDGSEVCAPIGEIDPPEGWFRLKPFGCQGHGRGQRHYPGLFWSRTRGGHLVYESLLELGCGLPTSIGA